jgi:hypothetical protein
MTDRSNDPTAHDLPTTAEQAPVAPHLVRMEATERDTLQLTVAYTDEGREQRVSLLITHTTPGAHDGLPAEEHAQPVLVVWGCPTAPLARVALRAQLVAPGWEPYRSPEEEVAEGRPPAGRVRGGGA